MHRYLECTKGGQVLMSAVSADALTVLLDQTTLINIKCFLVYFCWSPSLVACNDAAA